MFEIPYTFLKLYLIILKLFLCLDIVYVCRSIYLLYLVYVFLLVLVFFQLLLGQYHVNIHYKNKYKYLVYNIFHFINRYIIIENCFSVIF